MTPESVAFIGLGAMGAPVALRLARSGSSLVGYDSSEPVRTSLAAQGLVVVPSALEAVRASSILITMLPTSQHVRACIDSVAPALRPDVLVVDMTSGRPQQTKAIGMALSNRGVQMVDAPVSGNVARAEKGDLTIMLGGDAPACLRARVVLEPLARVIYHMGPLGSGQAMKVLNNLASAASLWVASEVLAVGNKLGLDPALMVDVLNASTGSSNSTQHKIKPFVLSGRFDSRFSLPLMVKDLGIALELAESTAAHVPLSAVLVSQWSEALSALGTHRDHTEVARYVAERSGTRLWPAEASIASQTPKEST